MDTKYQNSNHWKLVFQDHIDFEFYIVETSIPFVQLVTESREWGRKDFVGYTTPENISITFREVSGFSTLDFLLNWRNEYYDEEKKEYRVLKSITQRNKSARLRYESGPSNNRIVNKIIKLVNLSFLGIGDITLQKETGDPLEIIANFSIEDVNIEL